jgi:hypothetical protein
MTLKWTALPPPPQILVPGIDFRKLNIRVNGGPPICSMIFAQFRSDDSEFKPRPRHSMEALSQQVPLPQGK